MASGMSKLIPSDPDKVMIIRRITPNILTCNVHFYRFSRIKIGGRGTVVKLRMNRSQSSALSPSPATSKLRCRTNSAAQTSNTSQL